MHDATHYGWLPPGITPDATTVPGFRRPDEYAVIEDETVMVRRGELVFWRAATPVEVALKAKIGPSTIAIHVHANHGRWIVECPDCHDCQYAVRDDPRFMCVSCANASVGGLWRPVIWPREHKAIEAVLDARPHPEHRNWNPGETAADLREEGRKVGIEPTDPREHAIWAGLSETAADEWVAELAQREKEAGR